LDGFLVDDLHIVVIKDQPRVGALGEGDVVTLIGTTVRGEMGKKIGEGGREREIKSQTLQCGSQPT